MDERIAHNQQVWDRWTDLHVGSRYYDVNSFRAGKSSLLPLEVTEVGEVRGKSLLHLQCHFGMDTLSWARAGATVTGVDLSERAIAEAGKLATEVGLPARFVASDVYALQENLTGVYDVVLATWGVLSWLPDLRRWAEIVAGFVAEGGVFYLADMHPMGRIFDDRYPPVVSGSYFREGAIEYREPVSYADPTGPPTDGVSYMWLRPIGEAVTALAGAGLVVQYVHEFPYCMFQRYSWLEQGADGFWHAPDPWLPLTVSIRAARPPADRLG